MSGISPQQKKDPQKRNKRERKKKVQRLKSKRDETSYEQLHVSKGEKKRIKFASSWERFYQN
jgi:hypothetical protein